ncbi:hypothetical protein NG755_02430 [Aliarcobacter cryaerophilus]|uniref:hypothetical protein n=1 Tax=Aliarcobacter cryaerophilus TaxID=28198 RepID=UPI001653F45F|nr:hypothetical protein [Aliarcobacter cryaerophilus]QNM87693.1 hypothetical protein HOO41_08185 [Aliarcobacter cryaerophilus]
MEIMVEIWKYWFFIGTFIILLVLKIEISAIKDRINGASGFIWTMINLILAIATGILWIISIIFMELGTLFLYLFYSIIYFIINIQVSSLIFDYYSNKRNNKH